MSTVQIIFLVLSIIVVVGIIIFLFSGEICYQVSLKRNCYIATHIGKEMKKRNAMYKIDFKWWDTVNYKTLNIKSSDGLNLTGYYIKNDDQKIAVIVHGYGSNAFEMQQYAKMFCELNYSILAVDNRAHGNSDGKTITMGHKDCQDVALWVNYLKEQYPNSKIVVYGLSMGGATVCLYSALKKPENVKAIVSDCAYCNAFDIFESVKNQKLILKVLPILKYFNWYLKKRIGYKLTDISVKDAMPKCDVPILLIHGDKDSFVPFYMRDNLYNNTPQEFRHKLTINGAEHAESLPKQPEVYMQNVKEFLDKYV